MSIYMCVTEYETEMHIYDLLNCYIRVWFDYCRHIIDNLLIEMIVIIYG